MKISAKSAALLPVTTEETWHWDDTLKGFAVRVRPSGAKLYYVRYKQLNGKKAKVSLGRIDQVRCESARERAREILEASRLKKDPRAAEREAKNGHTIADLAKEHQALHQKISANYKADNARVWKNHIVPRLGKILVRELSAQQVEKMHVAMAETPYQANRALACLSKALNDCAKWDPPWRDRVANPCTDVKHYDEEESQTILEPAQVKMLLSELQKLQKEYGPGSGQIWSAPYLLAVLLFSGLRLREWACAEWDWYDPVRGTLTIPKTKRRKNFVSHLSPVVMGILGGMPRPTKWIFPNAGHTGPLQWPGRLWRRFRRRLGLEHVRLHDIRHTFASYAHMDAGLSLREIGELLGHTNSRTTQRYVNVSDSRKRSANAKGADAIALMATSTLLASE